MAPWFPIDAVYFRLEFLNVKHTLVARLEYGKKSEDTIFGFERRNSLPIGRGPRLHEICTIYVMVSGSESTRTRVCWWSFAFYSRRLSDHSGDSCDRRDLCEEKKLVQRKETCAESRNLCKENRGRVRVCIRTSIVKPYRVVYTSTELLYGYVYLSYNGRAFLSHKEQRAQREIVCIGKRTRVRHLPAIMNK